MNFVTFERDSLEPTARPMNAQRAGEMAVGIWKIDTRAGLPSSPSTGALRRRRLSASFWTFIAFFSRRLDSEISSETVSRTARRRAVIDFASVSRRTSSTSAVSATGVATGATTAATGATVAFATFALGAAAGAAAGAATGAVFVAFAGAAGATGAATATSDFADFVTFFAEAGADIILGTEVETEDILRRTYCYCSLEKSLFASIFAPGLFTRSPNSKCVCFYFEAMSLAAHNNFIFKKAELKSRLGKHKIIKSLKP